ncbi:cation:proton antiporter [Candidatus Woesearchaeota archaeon]|nr:cation:proton antiporter [Candidatus Woesearchaeota archaeon]
MENQLLTVGLLMFFAIIGSVLSAKVKQPAVVGLLIIGMIIGPNATNLVTDSNTINLMIEFGAILFLFIIGMEFSLPQLKKIGGKSLVVALFKVGIMFFLGFLLTSLFGMDFITAAFVGVIFSFSSTMIITNILKQKSFIKKQEVPLLIGVLVLEDIFGIVALTFFSVTKNAGISGMVSGIEKLLISLIVMSIIYVIISKFAENIIKWIMKNTGDEVITLISLSLCAGFAYIAYLLGLSPSAGAFLAGSLLSTFKESKLFERSVKPHTILFSSFFFISMGTLINVKAIFDNLFVIILFSIAIIISLQIAIGVVTRLFADFSKKGAMFASIAMLPPGVFSMLVAKESISYGVSLDLVTITSIIILLMSIVLSLAISKTDKFVIESNKQSIIKVISNKLSTFLYELDTEHFYSKKIKRRAGLVSMFILGLIILTTILYEIIILNINIVLKIFLLTIISSSMIALVYFIIKTTKKIFEYTINIFSNLQGGTNIKKTRNFIKHLFFGLLLLLIGLFFPMFLFVLDKSKLVLIIPVCFVLIGLIMIVKSNNYAKHINLEYKYTIHKFKKINVSSKYFLKSTGQVKRNDL